MNNTKISIIIPTYNNKNYIGRAINSVKNQLFSSIFEIIVIDDASTDDTDKYIRKNFPDIILIRNTEKKNSGIARNSGINKAKGKYIYFLDSDDWIEPNSLNELLKIAENDKAEITAFGAFQVNQSNIKSFYHGYTLKSSGGNEALDLLTKYKIASVVWNKLYLKEFLIKNKIEFNNAYRHQDVMFTVNAIFKCKKYVSISEPYYNYYRNANSVVNSKPTYQHLDSYIRLLFDMNNFIVNNKIEGDIKYPNLSNDLIKKHCLNELVDNLIRYKYSTEEKTFYNNLEKSIKTYFGLQNKIIEELILNLISDKEQINEKSKKSKTLEDFEKQYIKTKKHYEKQLNILNNQLISTQEQLKSNNTQLQQSVDKLHEIYSSQGWRILRHLYLIRDFFIPKNSFIKKYFEENILLIKNLKTRFLNVWHRLNTKKNINLKSRKIVYVGHSYHTKTKSTAFLIEHLKKYFDVTEVIDESWLGEKLFPNLSFIDKSYIGVIFFQNIPDIEVIKKINNDNIIFFPMYDNVGGRDYDFWKKYIDVKIINFSKTLHKRLKNWGLDSIYVQYFSKPLPFVKNKTHKVFFWQRTNAIDINLVEKLFGNLKTKIHFHQAVDPNCTFVGPSKEQEKKFDIKYSSWFNTREEMQQKIQECDIYIAPREYEGIGMSFLEAMSMGKVVIAINNPTMNEYITNNQTGYLFDKDNLKPINFSKISEIRKNTYNYVKNGYKNWEKEKNKIIKFIEK